MPTSTQAALEALGLRLVQHGYRFRVQPIFSPSGIFVYSPRDVEVGLTVIEHGVFLYGVDSEWEARVTQHGGSQWVCNAHSISALEHLALGALQAAEPPPLEGWRLL